VEALKLKDALSERSLEKLEGEKFYVEYSLIIEK